MFIIFLTVISLVFTFIYLHSKKSEATCKSNQDLQKGNERNIVERVLPDLNLIMLNDDKDSSDPLDEVYISKETLKSLEGTGTSENTAHNQTVYSLGDTTFVDPERIPENEHVEFEMYAQKLEEAVQPNDDLQMDSLIDESTIRTLKINLQKVPNGYIVNNIIYITKYGWHTLVIVSENQFQCICCDMLLHEEDLEEHLPSQSHVNNLLARQPLMEYEIMIVRKINNKFHCGICNEVHENIDEHLETKTHEEKYLYAMNKASDIDVDSLETSQKDCYHFKDTDYETNEASNCYEDNEDNYENEDFFYNNNGYSPESYPNTNRFVEYDEVIEPAPLISYANVAKKPRRPDRIDVKMGSEVKGIVFDYWHMIRILKDKTNTNYHCMACNVLDPVANKPNHCKLPSHLDNLKRFVIDENYYPYLIRQVNDKLFHCGHCNNLQVECDLKDHLMYKHPRKNNKIYEPSLTDTEASGYNHNGINKSDKNRNNATIDLNRQYSTINSESVFKTNSFSDKYLVYSFPNMKARITLLSYNMVTSYSGKFYCVFCDITLELSSLDKHIFHPKEAHSCEPAHLEILQRTPFVQPFGAFFIRGIREYFHCGVCNFIVIPVALEKHMKDATHISQFQSLVTNTQPSPKPLSNINTNDDLTFSDPNLLNTVTASIKPVSNTYCSNPHDTETQRDTDTITNNIGIADKTTNDLNGTKTPQLTDIYDTKTYSESDNDDLNNSGDIEPTFDTEELVCIVLKNSRYETTNTSYNSLVTMGDGQRYCFVCAVTVPCFKLHSHVESKKHEANIARCRFLDGYCDHLLRQNGDICHCGRCNVVLSSSSIRDHLAFPAHEEAKLKASTPQTGIKQIVMDTHTDVVKPSKLQIKIKMNVLIRPKEEEQKRSAFIRPKEEEQNRSKVILFQDLMLKLSWEHWHGICSTQNTFRCMLCKDEYKREPAHEGLLNFHVTSSSHKEKLYNIDKEKAPALLRVISASVFHCLYCNVEVQLKGVQEHLLGKKHKKTYDTILKESSCVNAFDDCDDVVEQL